MRQPTRGSSFTKHHEQDQRMTSRAFKTVSHPASGGVGEFITEARLDALNRALDAHGVMA